MAHWQETLTVWGRAWGALREVEAGVDGDVVTFAGNVPERLQAWPSDAAAVDGGVLHLVTEDPAAARRFAASAGLRETGSLVLLSAVTEDLDLIPSLPADAYVVEAPMEGYDMVEVAMFDRPAADGRYLCDDGLAVLGRLTVLDGHDELVDVFEQAMAATMGEDAFVHGADILYLVADAAQAERFAAVEGWSKVAEILSFAK